MHQRGVLFSTTLVLVALVLVAPFALVGGYYAWDCYESGALLDFESSNLYMYLPSVLDVATAMFDRPENFWLGSASSMVRNQYCGTSLEQWNSPSDWTYRIYSTDPETGVTTKGGTIRSEQSMVANQDQVQGYESHYFVGDSNRAWAVDRNRPGHAFEKTDSGYVECSSNLSDGKSIPAFYETPDYNYAFVLDGHLTIVVETSYARLEVFQLGEKTWDRLGTVNLPDTTRSWQRPDGGILFEALAETVAMPKSSTGIVGLSVSIPAFTAAPVASNAIQTISFTANPTNATVFSFNTNIETHPQKGKLRILTRDSVCHLFWELPNGLLYRQGLDLQPVAPPSEESDSSQKKPDRVASAIEPKNVVAETSDWFLIDKLARSSVDSLLTISGTTATTVVLPPYAQHESHWSPMFVDNQPTVVMTQQDAKLPGTTHAKAYRFDSGKWTEFASTKLPYSASAGAVGTRDDGSVSYLTTSTPLGRNQVLAIEPTGFRLTQVDQYIGLWGLDGYLGIAVVLWLSLLVGAVLGTVATALMCRDRAQYEFGIQSVQLASVFERGLARTIDMALLTGLSTAISLKLISLSRLDWRTALEALSIQDVAHPAYQLGGKLVLATIAAAACLMLAFTLVQGVYGITPGKWICGLKTMRATLKPCGFARSLLREVLLCIDSLNLLCWTPGILFIAHTRFRQRMGDLVADTVVVRTRSIGSSVN